MVVRCGGFSAAARRMGIPRSTVSLHVKTLEDELRTRLLKRSTRTISVTESGQNLYDKVSDKLESVVFAIDEARERNSSRGGLIRITAPADFPARFLSQATVEFRRLYPDSYFEIILSNTNLNMVKENIDIAIGLTRRTDGDRVAKTLIKIQWGFYASSVWLKKNDYPQTIGGIVDFISPGNKLRELLQNKIVGLQHLPVGFYRTNNNLMIKELILSNAGVGFLPSGLLKDELLAGSVKEVLTSLRIEEVNLTLEFPSRADILPRIRLFSDHLISIIRDGAS